jgi:hypothetical protein
MYPAFGRVRGHADRFERVNHHPITFSSSIRLPSRDPSYIRHVTVAVLGSVLCHSCRGAVLHNLPV